MAEQYVITELSISDVRLSLSMPRPEQTPIGPFDSREAAFEYAHEMQRRYGNGGGSVEVGLLVPPTVRHAAASEGDEVR